MSENEFSVWWWDAEGYHHPELRWVDAKTAVERAKSMTERPAALMGVIKRVIITDGGDFCVFEWKAGEGVVFPPKEAFK